MMELIFDGFSCFSKNDSTACSIEKSSPRLGNVDTSRRFRLSAMLLSWYDESVVFSKFLDISEMMFRMTGMICVKRARKNKMSSTRVMTARSPSGAALPLIRNFLSSFIIGRPIREKIAAMMMYSSSLRKYQPRAMTIAAMAALIVHLASLSICLSSVAMSFAAICRLRLPPVPSAPSWSRWCAPCHGRCRRSAGTPRRRPSSSSGGRGRRL